MASGGRAAEGTSVRWAPCRTVCARSRSPVCAINMAGDHERRSGSSSGASACWAAGDGRVGVRVVGADAGGASAGPDCRSPAAGVVAAGVVAEGVVAGGSEAPLSSGDTPGGAGGTALGGRTLRVIWGSVDTGTDACAWGFLAGAACCATGTGSAGGAWVGCACTGGPVNATGTEPPCR